MRTLKLTAEEVEVMRDVVARVISDMQVEVFRTDRHDFKEMLKHRRQVLEGVLDRLQHEPAPVM
jgi:hypothetical protein